MLLIALIAGIVLLLVGLSRSVYKGQYRSLRNFLVTMFFLDLVFDDWDVDSDVTDVDF
jgi:hypothetical protein